MKKALFSGLVLSFALVGGAGAQEKFDHSAYERLLAAYTSQGRVDYYAWKAKGMDTLLAYLTRVSHANVGKIKSKEERLAFYLNAYNAIAIIQVLENYPLKSIKDVKGFSDRLQHMVGSEVFTLNGLESKIRNDFSEPRVAFALNPGATGYPPLSNRAYRGDSLNAQLEAAKTNYLNNPRNVRLDKKAKILYLSKVFDWYQKELEAATGSVRTFLKLNLSEEFQKELEREPYELKYLPFDWSLNGK